MNTCRERWYILSGAMKLSESLRYEDILYLAERAMKESGHSLVKDVVQMDLDIARVSRETIERFFGKDYSRKEILEANRRVLMAFCFRNPQLGYVQSMLNLCMVVLSEYFEPENIFEEERAFLVFCCLIEVNIGRNFFSKSPPLQGFRNAVELIRSLISNNVLDELENVDQGDIVNLLSMKWILQLWADEDVLYDVGVLKRLWDYFFLASAGCLDVCNYGDAFYRDLYKKGIIISPRETDFHVRLAAAMINYISSLETEATLMAPNSPVRIDVPSIAKLRHGTQNLRVSLSPKKNADDTQEKASFSTTSKTDEFQDLGAHATGFVYTIFIEKIRFLTPRKLDQIISVVNSERKKDAATKCQDTLIYCKSQMSSEHLGVIITREKFLGLLESSYPACSNAQATAIFSLLDTEDSGYVNTYRAIQQMPDIVLPDEISRKDFEIVAKCLYTLSITRVRVGTVPRDIADNDENCSGPSCCIH